tara:strand:+ start:129 stop:317 length:189 start_codon:yes stop_codon:yes gene_type:complete
LHADSAYTGEKQEKIIENYVNVVRIVKVPGMVNSASGLTAHSQVINGYSDFKVKIFGMTLKN